MTSLKSSPAKAQEPTLKSNTVDPTPVQSTLTPAGTSNSNSKPKPGTPAVPTSPHSHPAATASHQPLISKSGVLRILSELVRSYAGCAKIITQHVYKASDFLSQYQISLNETQASTNNNTRSPLIMDDCNALAFLLDNLLASNQTFGDKDCPSLCRLLIVALASCNHCLDSQNALVQEVKQALNRAVSLPESSDKHIKIQAFASIINTMIETCPPIQNVQQQQQAGLRNLPNQLNLVNNMMKIMHKKSLINDLARVPHHMDLSCLKCTETLNTLLKPLETMTKTLNISAKKREAVAAAKSSVEARIRGSTVARTEAARPRRSGGGTSGGQGGETATARRGSIGSGAILTAGQTSNLLEVCRNFEKYKYR